MKCAETFNEARANSLINEITIYLCLSLVTEARGDDYATFIVLCKKWDNLLQKHATVSQKNRDILPCKRLATHSDWNRVCRQLIWCKQWNTFVLKIFGETFWFIVYMRAKKIWIFFFNLIFLLISFCQVMIYPRNNNGFNFSNRRICFKSSALTVTSPEIPPAMVSSLGAGAAKAKANRRQARKIYGQSEN